MTMKRSKVITDRPSSGSSTSSRSGSERTNGTAPLRKASACDKKATSGQPLAKTLSKSHDNLASQLRKKAAQASLKASSTASPAKFKTPKGTPIRKARSNPTIDNASTPIKRTQSEQNIANSPRRASQTEGTRPNSGNGSSVKHASSSHNVSSPRGGQRCPRGGTTHSAMAYNAELLASFEKEKKALERRISELIQTGEERKTEIEKLKFRVKHLQEGEGAASALREENAALKSKLNELGVKVDHYTDSEKLSLLRGKKDECDGAVGEVKEEDLCELCDLTAASSLDNNWDRQSTKSSDGGMSEVSVACLQDRILQMEETHYSTNEELQATLQELGDLQDAVNELTCENESLADEKSVLLESLCAQTEKLENARLQIEHLKVLLVTEAEGRDRSENERQLMGLIQSSQEEREELLLRQVECSNVIHSLEAQNRELQDAITALRDKVRLLEMKQESLGADKRALEAQVLELREQAARDQIEAQRWRTQLDSERQKVAELEQERQATDPSELQSLLDTARAEKERLEQRVGEAQAELALSQNEARRHLETIASLEEEVKVCKNNAKTEVSDLQYQLDQNETEKVELRQQVIGLRDHIDTLQLDCDRYLEDKKTHGSLLSSLETELQEARQQVQQKEEELSEVRQQFSEAEEEWRQFQADLQMAVVIANNIKSEAQEDMEQIISEKQALREETRQQSREITRLKEEVEALKQRSNSNDSAVRNDIRGRVLSSVDRELAVIRQGRKLSDSRGGSGNQCMSVKHIINSIEMTGGRGGNPLSPTLQEPRRRNSESSDSKSDTSPLRSPLDRTISSPAPQEAGHKGVLRRTATEGKENRPSPFRHTISDIILEGTPEDKMAASPTSTGKALEGDSTPKKPLTGILSNKKKANKNEPENKGDKSPFGTPHLLTGGVHGVKTDPLALLAKQMGGSKRNALLKWCQNKTNNYANIDITNFSSSWNDGLAFCALMHSYLPDRIPYKELSEEDKVRNFSLAFKAAESVGIPSTLNLNDMVSMERPDWQAVMHYITSIYKHFEVDTLN